MYDAPKAIGVHESAWFTYRGDGGNPGGNDWLEPRAVTRRLSSTEASWKRPCLKSEDIVPAVHLALIAWREAACGIKVASREQPKPLGVAEAGV